MFSKEDTILLSISGGIDSMVMLHLFLEAGFKFVVGHINHHLRGVESDQDAEFVRNYCKKFDIFYFEFNIDPILFESGNIQSKARELRYAWLQKVVMEGNFNFIATAHHSDDHVETFIIHLMRGSGLKGLSGISSQTNNIIRPIMFASKQEIEEYALLYQVPYREDRSNQTDKYLRNRIRHVVIPAMVEAQENAMIGIKKSINYISQSENLINYFVEKSAKDIVVIEGGDHIFDLNSLPIGDIGIQLLFLMIEKFGFNFDQSEDIFHARFSTGKQFFANNYLGIFDRGKLIITLKESIEPETMDIPISLPFERQWYDYNISIKSVEKPYVLSSSGNILHLDGAILDYKIRLRNVLPGEKFKPMGMGGKSQKMQDFMVNQKFSIIDKKKTLVLVQNDTIVCVVGHRVSEIGKVKNSSNRVLEVKVSKLKD